MKDLIFKTNNDWTGLIIRFTLGLFLLPHGAQKMLGTFGGFGFSNTMFFFTFCTRQQGCVETKIFRKFSFYTAPGAYKCT